MRFAGPLGRYRWDKILQVGGSLAPSPNHEHSGAEGVSLAHSHGSRGALSRDAIQVYLQNIVLLPSFTGRERHRSQAVNDIVNQWVNFYDFFVFHTLTFFALLRAVGDPDLQ